MKIDMAEGLVPINQPVFHFYGHNAFEWRTGDNLHALMKEMDKPLSCGARVWVETEAEVEVVR